jgi:hypothetical protein
MSFVASLGLPTARHKNQKLRKTDWCGPQGLQPQHTKLQESRKRTVLVLPLVALLQDQHSPNYSST